MGWIIFLFAPFFGLIAAAVFIPMRKGGERILQEKYFYRQVGQLSVI